MIEPLVSRFLEYICDPTHLHLKRSEPCHRDNNHMASFTHQSHMQGCTGDPAGHMPLLSQQSKGKHSAGGRRRIKKGSAEVFQGLKPHAKAHKLQLLAKLCLLQRRALPAGKTFPCLCNKALLCAQLAKLISLRCVS